MRLSPASPLYTFFIFILVLHTGKLGAQTNRYWSVNFDQESFLLSGAVVGGGTSLGSIYYNPASIAFQDNTRVSLNSSIFSFQWYVFKNGLGNDLDVRFNNITVLPPYVSFLVKGKNNDRFSAELAVFTKEEEDLYVQEGFQDFGDFIPALDGDEVRDIFYNYSQRFNNLWIGAGVGYQLNDRISIGLSNFILAKSNRYNNNIEIDLFAPRDSLTINGNPSRYFASSLQSRQVTQSTNFQLRWKFGITYKIDRGSVGLTVTTPSVNVIKSANSSIRVNTLNVLNADGEIQDDIFIKDQGEKLKSDFRDPFSVALGLTYLFPQRKWEVYLTAEFFAGIPIYKSVEGKPNQNIGRPSTIATIGTDDILTQYRGAVPLINFALGVKHSLRNSNFLIFGARTDFSMLRGLDYGDIPSVNIPIQSNYDVFHLTSGYQFVFLRLKWVLGLEFSLGRRSEDFQLTDISPKIDPDLSGVKIFDERPKNMNVRYNAISIFIGFDFSFGKKEK